MKRWSENILECETHDEVMALVREYMSAWTPSQVAEMPAGTWPGQVTTHDEVKGAAARLKIAELSEPRDAVATAKLRQLGAVLSAASLRLAQLARGNDARSGS